MIETSDKGCGLAACRSAGGTAMHRAFFAHWKFINAPDRLRFAVEKVIAQHLNV